MRSEQPARPPFPFVVGSGRSGTTLLRAMLDAHPDMAVPPENHFLMPIARNRRRFERGGVVQADLLLRMLEEDRTFRLWNLPGDRTQEVLEAEPPTRFPEAVRRLYGLYAERRGKPRYGDKTPHLVRHLPFLGHTFPEARFVHIIRDGRDVVSAYLARGIGPRNVVEGAWWWKREVLRGRRGARRLDPERYMEVRYEDLVRDPESRLKEICRFVDLHYDEAMLTYHRDPDQLLPAERVRRLHDGLFRPPTEGMRDWRVEMANRDVADFESLAGDLLSDLGYERAVPHPPMADRARARRRWIAIRGNRLRRRTGGILRGGHPAVVPRQD